MVRAVTEEKARGMWCPMVTIYSVASCSLSRDSGDAIPIAAHCIGSDCMMWQWEPTRMQDAQAPKSGFCGLVRS